MPYSLSPFPIRPEVQAFTPYSPGLSIDEIREKYGLEFVVKMASNENPLGVSPLVKDAINQKAGLTFRYAQSGSPRLAASIAAHHGLSPAAIVAGNGSDELIDLIVRTCPTPGKNNVLACRPCFSLYGLQSRFCGVEFRQVDVREDFSFDWDGLLNAVDENTAVCFITTPDNPSGWCPPVGTVRDFAKKLPKTCLLVIDEAYMDFAGDEPAYSMLQDWKPDGNLAILRTFSKSYGLAGLRLGYGILPLALADCLRRVRPPFSINILAEEAGIAALADTAFRQATLSAVSRGREYLSSALAGLGCKVHPSRANFIMFGLPGGCAKKAFEVFEELLAKGLIIRPLKSYGMPDLLRVSVGNDDENKMFVRLLSEAIGS